MEKQLIDNLRMIGQGLLDDAEPEDEDKVSQLGQFLIFLADDGKLDEDCAEFIVSSADRLNDSVVPFFHYLYENGKDIEWYKCIAFLFDENIDLVACHDLLIKAVENGIPCDFFDDILKNSPTQEAFEKAIQTKLERIQKKSVSPTAESQEKKVSSISSGYDFGREFIEHLKKENERLADQADSYKSTIDAFDKTEKQLLEQVESAQKEIAGQKSSFESIQKDFSRLQTNFNFAEKKLALAHEMIAQVKSINAGLTQKTTSVEKQYKDEISSLKIELADSKEAAVSLREEKSSIISERDSLSTELESVKAERDAASGKNEELSAEVVRLNELVQQLTVKINGLNEEIVDLNGEIRGLRNGKGYSPSVQAHSKDPLSPDNLDGNDDDEYEFSFLNSDVEDIPQPPVNFGSDFTDSLFTDEDAPEYAPEDVSPIENKKNFIQKSCSFFGKLLSMHFEKKFQKKPQQEQNNLIFIKLMEGNFSKDIIRLVKKTVEGDTPVSRVELYRLISNRGSEDEIVNFCRNAA